MKIRFQADADLKQTIVTGLLRREPAVDFRTAVEAGLAGVLDPEVLARTAEEGRILVSHEAQTMPRHFGEFIASTDSPGVLIVPQHLPIADAVEAAALGAGETPALPADAFRAAPTVIATTASLCHLQQRLRIGEHFGTTVGTSQ